MLLKKFLARPLSIIARAPDILPAFLAVTLLSRRADGRGRDRFFDVGGLAGVLKEVGWKLTSCRYFAVL